MMTQIKKKKVFLIFSLLIQKKFNDELIKKRKKATKNYKGKKIKKNIFFCKT